jgi:hypothetical protein
MRAEDVTGIANKVAKGGERTQELIHKAVPQQRQLEDVEEHRGDSNGGSNCA